VVDVAIKVVEVVSIAKQGIDKPKVIVDSTLTMRLKVFEDDADIAKAIPLIDVIKTKTIKGQVAGETEASLTAREVEEIKKEFQAEIDRYTAEQRIQTSIDVKAISDSLDVSKVSKISIEAVVIDG
jgi:hypothetical protein